MLHLGRCLSTLLAAALLACSPALNWREVRFDGGVPLRMLLPCKPDRAERELAMAGQAVRMQMIGCEADGATFAVSHVRVADAAGAAALLAGWKAAALAHVGAQPVLEQSWLPPGGWVGLHSQRVRATGRDAKGQSLALEAAWFGVAGPAGTDLFHAVMFSPRSRPETAETFFAGVAAAP
jgi:hypothetical protein